MDGGAEAKALLKASDGSGLRCDLKGMAPASSGAGQDDKVSCTTYRFA